MNGDARGWRIALLPAALVNPRPSTVTPRIDVLAVIEANGYGLLQLPPPGRHHLLLAVIADQVAEYSHHGYALVAVGVRGDVSGLHWRRLAALLKERGAALPPRHLMRPGVDIAMETARLHVFLAGSDIAEEERRRWRT